MDAIGQVERRYLYADGIDQLLAVESVDYGTGSAVSEDVLWTLADQQNTIRDVYGKNDSGEYEVLSEIRYDAFGRSFDFGAAAPDERYDIAQRYTGLELDRETGFQNSRSRYYDLSTRVFVSADGIGFASGQTNLYQYVGNSPANFVDPSGNVAFTATAIVGIGVAAFELYGYYAATQAETQFDESSAIISQANISVADFERADALRNSAQWNLATANIGAAAGVGFAGGFLGGAAFGAIGTLGAAGTAFGVGFSAPFLVNFGQDLNQLRQDWPGMSAVQRYEAGGSLTAGVLAGGVSARSGFAFGRSAGTYSLRSASQLAAGARSLARVGLRRFGGNAARGGIQAIGLLDEAVETALLRGHAENLAQALGGAQSNSRRGPVLTLLRDRATGEVFHAQNFGEIPSNLHPLLTGRIGNYLAANSGKLNPVWGIPGSHSEITALNQALLRREALGIGVQSLDDFALYNVSLWNNRLGTVVPRCGNCKVLTNGVRVLSGN